MKKQIFSRIFAEPQGRVRALKKVALLLAIPVVTACAGISVSSSGITRWANYGMEFSRWDRPTIHVMDYQYSANGKVFVQWDRALRDRGEYSGGIGRYGWYPIPDKLYVKWKLSATNEVFEETVDLQSRLPFQMEGKQIYFLVWDKELHVYLATGPYRPISKHCKPIAYYKENGPPKFSSADEAMSFSYCRYPVTKIYPTQYVIND